ncbi:MAG: hypothetical protein G01um101470_555 [Parcubacteria group bacterium Gr01-1014_70]|nr:MAG: hypothetical protein G01um101470_555 [Parcubacteria group bacterium Gr01-1014_70]
MPSNRPIDTFTKQALHILETEYVVLGSERVRSSDAWVIITFLAGFVVAGAMLASRSGTFESASAATTIYQASTGFSSTQGANGWSYRDSSGANLTYYTNHVECSGEPCWHGSEPYLLLKPYGGHPGTTKDSVRRWTSPGTGSVRITGNVHDTGGVCSSDGIVATIKNGSTVLWQQTITDGDTVGKNFDLTSTVSSGSTIDFQLNRLSINRPVAI